MAKLRSVNTHFWTDGYIVKLDPTEKYLFLYLLTNPFTNIAGCYEISTRQIAFDTGIDAAMIEKIFNRFMRDKKIIYKDGWLFLVNFIKNQNLNANMRKGVETLINTAPDWCQETLSNPLKAFQSLRELELELELEGEADAPQPTPKKISRKTKFLTTIPPDFKLTDEMRKWFSENIPHRFSVEKEFTAFVDRCTAKGTEYKDWIAGWRTQMNNVEKFSGNTPNGNQSIPVPTVKIERPPLSPMRYAEGYAEDLTNGN